MQNTARIIIVDDDEIIRRSFSTVLEGAGYVVETAENGAEAIRKAESNFYNLALIDIRLPDMDGTQLLTKMRDTFPNMIKIIVTGYPSLQNAIEAINKGADGYVVKPTKMDELLGMVRKHLEKQRELQQFGEGKIKDYVESRLRELEAEQQSTPEPK